VKKGSAYNMIYLTVIMAAKKNARILVEEPRNDVYAVIPSNRVV
jgi:hypothetical protein